MYILHNYTLFNSIHGAPSKRLSLAYILNTSRTLSTVTFYTTYWASCTFNSSLSPLVLYKRPEYIITNKGRNFTFILKTVEIVKYSWASCATLIHAFTKLCPRIDFCNSLLIGLPKVRLYPIRVVLDKAARLIALFPRYSHISTYGWWTTLATSPCSYRPTI